MALYSVERQVIDTSIRSVVQLLPRTADTLVDNDIDLEQFEPGTFRARVKATVAYLIRLDLQMLYVYHPMQTPPCRILAAALFSASAVKNGLLNDDFIHAFTRYGLQLPASETFGDEREEAAVIGALGACLQLITAGSGLWTNTL